MLIPHMNNIGIRAFVLAIAVVGYSVARAERSSRVAAALRMLQDTSAQIRASAVAILTPSREGSVGNDVGASGDTVLDMRNSGKSRWDTTLRARPVVF